jgi:hypothetical protein
LKLETVALSSWPKVRACETAETNEGEDAADGWALLSEYGRSLGDFGAVGEAAF